MPAESDEGLLPVAAPHVLAWIGCSGAERWWPWDPPCAMPHCNRFLGVPRQIGWHATGGWSRRLQSLTGADIGGCRLAEVRRRCALLGLAFRPTIAAEENKEMT